MLAGSLSRQLEHHSSIGELLLAPKSDLTMRYDISDCTRGSLTLVSSLTHPYPAGLKTDLMQVCSDSRVSNVCSYNVLLGKLFVHECWIVSVRSCGIHLHMHRWYMDRWSHSVTYFSLVKRSPRCVHSRDSHYDMCLLLW